MTTDDQAAIDRAARALYARHVGNTLDPSQTWDGEPDDDFRDDFRDQARVALVAARAGGAGEVCCAADQDIEHGWHVEHHNHCTCGSPLGQYPHEPGCGTVPLGPVTPAPVTVTREALAAVLSSYGVKSDLDDPTYGIPFDRVTADLAALAAPTTDGLAQAWDEGYRSGQSRAMRRMSDEPDVAPDVNPYREVTPDA